MGASVHRGVRFWRLPYIFLTIGLIGKAFGAKLHAAGGSPIG